MARFLHWLRYWDWRPLARLMTWALIAGRFGIITRGGLAHLGRELILSWLLTFGILTYVQLLLLMGMVRLYFALDDGSYRLAEWLAKPWVGDAPFTVKFIAALTAQIGLVWLCASACRWAWP